jgi:hypothetical protein
MLTPRELGTCCCVLLLQVLCRMKKLIGGVKRAFSFGPSSRALAHAPVMDHKTPHGLHPLCLHHMRLGGQSAVLHTMTFLWPQTVMTFPSVAPWGWRSMSLSTSESLVTLMYTMWTCSKGLEWMRSFPSPSRLLVGENSTDGIRWLGRWVDDFATVQTEVQASIDSQTSMMHDLFSHLGINLDA